MPILVQSFCHTMSRLVTGYIHGIVFSTDISLEKEWHMIWLRHHHTYLDGVCSPTPEEGMSPEEHELDMLAYSIQLI